MLMLNQKNPAPKGLIGAVLLCQKTGKQFVGKREDFTTNYATDRIGYIYSDEGVFQSTREDIANEESISMYISGTSQGTPVTGWKGDIHGRVLYCQTWKRYTRYRSFEMQQYKVRMFDGSIWTGRKSSDNDVITLRKQTS